MNSFIIYDSYNTYIGSSKHPFALRAIFDSDPRVDIIIIVVVVIDVDVDVDGFVAPCCRRCELVFDRPSRFGHYYFIATTLEFGIEFWNEYRSLFC